MNLDFSLDRSVLICARRAAVFRYFTDSKRFAAWWGEGSTIDPRVGGKVRIVYPGGSVASGEVLEIDEPSRVVFTYGYEDPSRPIPPGGSRVTIALEDAPGGTRVSLRHDVADPGVREMHVPGWRYQLSIFANVVAREAHAGAAAIVDRYFAAWSEKDAGARERTLEESVMDGVVFRDAFGAIEGRTELGAHIGAIQVHMPGVALLRDGEPLLCQGTALVRWIAKTGEGVERGRGRSAIDFSADGRVARAVGFWET
jgi:uncharacterized protein YndB with AHSA1/START domain